MSENTNTHFNLYDFFGFPDRTQRDEIWKVFDISKLRLMEIDDPNLLFFDIFIEKYNTWSHHINNFSSHLGLHLFLLYFQYAQGPSETIEMDKYQMPENAHKIFFDTFAEDLSLYLISYYDKHLEMFNDLYDLKSRSGKPYNLSREKIIKEMKKVEILKAISVEYQRIVGLEEFKQIKSIRHNFVHNKSSSYYGMNVRKEKTPYGAGYASYTSKGISTKEVYGAVLSLIKSYGQLCEKVNSFLNNIVKQAKTEPRI